MIRSAPPAPFKTALITFLIAAVVGLVIAQNAPARDANWKLHVTIDYVSTGTVTDSECFPNPSQVDPSPVSATVTRELTLRTVRPTTIQMYEAPNGVPATIPRGAPYKAQVTETREAGITTSGTPVGCYGSGSGKQDCGTRSLRSGAYVNPLGGVHSWKGFAFEPQQLPTFSNCGIAPAMAKLPDPLDLNIKASPGALTGQKPKLVFRKTQRFQATKNDGSIRSEATAKLTYTVKLTHR
ncbi:MAG: hypothetical protein M3335_03470 [Actinomycetota bacterium]|nr:hypothetical protein [Actinomycetota bacterium]